MTTHTTKWEDLEPEKIVENYIRLKEIERERNKRSYEKLKLNPEKYYERLNKNHIHQINYIEEQKIMILNYRNTNKEERKLIKKAYEKRKVQQTINKE